VTRPVNLFTGTAHARLSGDGCCEAIYGKTKGVGDAADVVAGCWGWRSLPRCGRKRLLIDREEVRFRTGPGSVKQAGGRLTQPIATDSTSELQKNFQNLGVAMDTLHKGPRLQRCHCLFSPGALIPSAAWTTIEQFLAWQIIELHNQQRGAACSQADAQGAT
jgi:hypothetical protein